MPISNSEKEREREREIWKNDTSMSAPVSISSVDLFQRSLVRRVASSSYIVVCLPRRMHRIITKLLTIPASEHSALFIRFVSIAWSEESKMAVNDRGTVSRQRRARTKTKEKKRKKRGGRRAFIGWNKKTLFGIGVEGEEMRRGGCGA